MFDVGHGGGGFISVANGDPGGCTPDTISSDIHVFSGNSPSILSAECMSKFYPGICSGAGGGDGDHGAGENHQPRAENQTLQIGAPGDVAIMELVEAQVTFLDTRNNKRERSCC
jgi:dihydroorotase